MKGVRWLALAACATAPTARAPAPQPKVETRAPTFRLPGDVSPTAYKLELAIDPTAERVDGAIAIDAQVVRSTKTVWLHAAPELTIKRARVDGRDVVPVRNDEFLGLPVAHERGAIKIAIEFAAPIDHQRSRGIYAEREGNESYAYTFFEATDARRAFPCFDEPAFKVPWTLSFVVAKEHVALSNARVVRETAMGAKKRVELAQSKPLPSYLVAFVVGPFDVVDGGTAGRVKTPIRFVLPKGRSGELAWATQITPRVVAALEDYFDMPYPYGKLDVAVVPRYWGTMEHPGIVAMGQPLTLIRPEQQTRERKQFYANILAHELAHYWFGDYVTMAWWDDTWLNEALGEWMDMIITDAVEPSWRHGVSRVGYATGAMSSDETLSVQAIRQRVTTREQIESAFDASITYFKGASVLRMFEAWVGRDKWRDMMRAYVRAHAWGTASADDLFDAIGQTFGKPVESAVRSFIEQPGVPVIKFEVDCAGQKLAVSQARSLPAGVSDARARSWTVPVCFRYGNATSAHEGCVLLDKPETLVDVATCPTWLVPNRDARGYYRSAVAYKLIFQLLDHTSSVARIAKPTAAEKMMIAADLRSQVDRAELPMSSPFGLAKKIVDDPDPKVAGSAWRLTSFRIDALAQPLYMKALDMVQAVFRDRAKALGWQRRAGDSDELHELRRQLVPLVAYHDKALGAEASRLVERWLRDRKGIDDDLVDAALEVAAHHGEAALFDRYLAAAKGARDLGERGRVLSAMGAFRKANAPHRALELALGTEFDLRETKRIVMRMLVNRDARDEALIFVAKNIDTLLPRMRDDEAAGFLAAVAGVFCDESRVEQAAAIVTARAEKIGGAKAAVTRGLEKSRQCIVDLARVAKDLGLSSPSRH